MKKVYMKISAGTMLAVAVALASCNNAEEVKKQTDEQNAKIQSMVDEKLGALQEQVNAECTAKVDSAAQVVYTAWLADEAAAAKKGGKKPAPKPKPKTETKKDETKPNTINNRPGTNENENKGTLNSRPGSNEGQQKDSKNTLNSRPGATTTPK